MIGIPYLMSVRSTFASSRKDMSDVVTWISVVIIQYVHIYIILSSRVQVTKTVLFCLVLLV